MLYHRPFLERRAVSNAHASLRANRRLAGHTKLWIGLQADNENIEWIIERVLHALVYKVVFAHGKV